MEYNRRMTIWQWAKLTAEKMPKEEAERCFQKCAEVMEAFRKVGLDDATDLLSDFMDVFTYAVEKP